MKDVCVIIVTWNRLEMLKRSVSAARAHAQGADVLVVDNASTDGTGEWLKTQEGVDVLSLPENTGGAGGFAAGMQRAFDLGYEWMWIMDDDVELLPEALANARKLFPLGDLVQTAKYEADGTECRFEGLVNPKTMRRRKISVASLPACGYVNCNIATFEGLLVNRSVVAKIGVPDASFFYGLDDLFYGYRASEVARFVFAGVFTLKKQIDKSRASIGGRRFYSSSAASRYYHVRNYWTVMRYLKASGTGSWRMYFTYAYEAAKAFAITLLLELDFKGAAHVLRGIVDGIRGRGGRCDHA